MIYDIAVIGGGVIGGAILRELSKYELKICLLEKENDVCMGQSKANSGIVHAGFDAVEGSLKAKFNLLGNLMMKDYANELGVKYQNNGSIVVAYSIEQIEALKKLKERGEKNGVKGLLILDGRQLKELEPNLAPDALAGLYAPTGGIISPYALTIATIGNAMDNGAELFTGFEVCKVEDCDDAVRINSVDGQSVEAKLVINCAGLHSGKVAELFGEEIIVKGRKGEYLLLDNDNSGLVRHTIFTPPTKKGKGILVSPTVDGNIILGPTATETEIDSTDTTVLGLNEVREKALQMIKNPPFQSVITSFAGIRAFTDKNDFIIEQSKVHKRLINCVGIESPGLTASPAIAQFIVESLVSKVLKLSRKATFDGKRLPSDYYSSLSIDEKNQMIKKDPSYGRIVCRCEKITEGEILNALRQNPKASDIDGVKRRTRAGMGRCQGGFCQPQVAEIIARELSLPLEQVTKSGGNSNLVMGVSK